jgi:ElaB/YqjD/DUF883 family membrane-anchored ribosome-binding protein
MEKISKDITEHGNTSLDNFIGDSKSLLNSSVGHVEDGLEKVKQSTNSTLDEINNKLKNLEKSIIVRSKLITEASTAYIHENPIKTVAAASASGLLIGLLLSTFRNQ